MEEPELCAAIVDGAEKTSSSANIDKKRLKA